MEIHGRSAANLGGSSRGVKKLKMATRVYRLENVGDCCWKTFPAPFFRNPSSKKKAKLNGNFKSLLINQFLLQVLVKSYFMKKNT